RVAGRAAADEGRGGRHARARLPRGPRRVGIPRDARRGLGGLFPFCDALVLRRALACAGRVVARLVGTRLRAAAARRHRRGRSPPLAIATIRAPRTAFFWGWASGTLFFLVLLRWLQYTFQVYSAIPWPLVYGPVLLLAAYCGFWTGAVAWAVSWLTARRSAALALALAPFLWVAAEWLRGHLFGGFPWGALGYSQYLRLRVIQIAELA